MNQFRILAPAFAAHNPSYATGGNAEHLGMATWLWMHSRNHCNLRLRSLADLLLPAVNSRQFVIVLEEMESDYRPVAYLAWANLSAQAESRYVNNPLYGLTDTDWNSGDRMWFTDIFAPFGRTQRLRRVLQPLFNTASARYLYHRSHERGLRVLTFVGARVDRVYARQWWRDRPVLAFKERDPSGDTPH